MSSERTLLAGAKWQPDDIRDDLQEYVADKLGQDTGPHHRRHRVCATRR